MNFTLIDGRCYENELEPQGMEGERERDVTKSLSITSPWD
jgi:hypothetical protein